MTADYLFFMDLGDRAFMELGDRELGDTKFVTMDSGGEAR